MFSLFCDETEEKKLFVDLFKSEREKQINSLLIGPEGGFSITEKNFLEKLNYIYGVSLGKRILRADTAAITALSLLIGEKYLK